MSTRYVAAVAVLSFLAGRADAQQVARPTRDSAQKLTTINVTAEREDRSSVKPIQLNTLPVTVSITQRRAEETVNLVDAEDAVKYLPSVFLRKRNNGDTQATLATRVWGTSSSARSLIFADGVPLTALIANNNTVGGPRWGLVAPPEVDRIDMMMGPYSAAYSGSSMGAVMEITTRLPKKLEGQIQQTQALQGFDLYGTKRNFATTQTGASVGDRFGNFAFWASGNFQKSNSQPLSYVTSAKIPDSTTGAVPEKNKLDAPANVLGASGLLNTHMTNGKIKMAYDVTPTLRASYTFGLWRNDGSSGVDPYLSNAQGQRTYAGQAGFASGMYDLDQRHTAQAFTLRTDHKKTWDVELVGSTYRFGFDQQRFPLAASASGTDFSTSGRVAVLDGTGWETLDLKGTWKPGGQISRHIVSSGVHWEHYTLRNATFNTSDWRNGDSRTGIFTEGDGKTKTKALWAQDQWYVTPDLKLTVGGRYEDWNGYEGINVSSTRIDCHGTQVSAGGVCAQPTVSGNKFSPKALLSWHASQDWTFTAAMAKAYRFATAAELYQIVSTGSTSASPDPNLKPDNVTSSELRAERRFSRGSVQLSLFQDDVHDAIISQFKTLNGSTQVYSFISNVDHVRARGAELAFGTNDVLIKGLAFSGNVTAVDPKTLALSGRAGAADTSAISTAVGKQLPNIPKWRSTVTALYRPDEHYTFTLAARYSSKLYTTLDNVDVRYNTYQGFSEWFVMDTKVNYRVNENWSTSLGVDNLLDRKYFLFHPFPHRTILAGLKYGVQ